MAMPRGSSPTLLMTRATKPSFGAITEMSFDRALVTYSFAPFGVQAGS